MVMCSLSLYADVLDIVLLTANEQKHIEALEVKLEDNITRKEVLSNF